MSDLFFCDLSNFNDPVDLPAYRQTNAVVAEQVNWGTKITDPNGRMEQIRGLKFAVVIWYMGLVATQDIANQVQTFVNTLGPLLPGEAICIDWEDTPGAGTPTAAQRDLAATLLGQHYNVDRVWIGTYGPASLLAQFPPPSWVWTASYETSEPPQPHVLWQFTNGQYVSNPYGPINFPGIGFCDASVFHGSVEQLAIAVCPTTPSPPPPVPDKEMSMILDPILTLPNGTDVVVQVGQENPPMVYGKGRAADKEWNENSNKALCPIIPGTVPVQRLSGGQVQVLCEQASNAHVVVFATNDGVTWGQLEMG